MAKRYARRRGGENKKHSSRPAPETPAPELSLEEILEEYRSQTARAEEESAPPEAEPLTMRAEEGVYTARLPEEPEAEPEASGEGAEEPAEEPLPDDGEEDSPVPPARPERRAAMPSPEELVEGYDDDADFYAGAADLPAGQEEDDASSPEEEPLDEEAPDEK